ncbi:CaiB/BaiF CoA-transferase family protein [Sphingobium sp. V4]|uniref:CaiB/BaiF CoA transferase family protein n=1 Tax=Sphingobium sp. V4 TaxID=3038927 RepID=UPI00255821CF|nr:CaiB/BaiF CoA-transferase family protein [Sphingobium sp. V4]WIW89500.1 CaiB/BaiF CoA-transferase family protein [Sphingobium sp. V4]
MSETNWPASTRKTGGGGLDGVRVLDLCVAGPGPFCTLILAGFGADVIHVSRTGRPDLTTESSHHNCGKRSVRINLKSDEGKALVRRLSAGADVIMEGFRPGVMERLGLGPDELMKANPGLIYVRMTGWGQTGPYAGEPGHDINYIGVGGALSQIGIDQPIPPLALLGDFSAGSLVAAINILSALRERDRTGAGAVIDTNIADGAAMLVHSLVAAKPRESGIHMRELLNGTAPFYRTYQCADDKWISVGCIEPKFYTNMLHRLGLADHSALQNQYDRSHWPDMKIVLSETFRSRTRDDWTQLLSLHETCVFPVLEPTELAGNEHLANRKTAVEIDGRVHVARAGRHIGQDPVIFKDPCVMGEHTDDVLREMGYSSHEIAALHEHGAIDGPWQV